MQQALLKGQWTESAMDHPSRLWKKCPVGRGRGRSRQCRQKGGRALVAGSLVLSLTLGSKYSLAQEWKAGLIFVDPKLFSQKNTARNSPLKPAVVFSLVNTVYSVHINEILWEMFPRGSLLEQGALPKPLVCIFILQAQNCIIHCTSLFALPFRKVTAKFCHLERTQNLMMFIRCKSGL